MLAIKLLACYKMNNVALKEVKQHKKFKINKNKILLILIIILLILCCIITKEYIKNMIEIDKAYKQYEAQLNAIKYKEQEEEAKRLAEEEKKKKEKMPILTDIGKENIKHIYSNETKRAFLTFDDGPSTITPEILDILKNENIKATFFVLGANVEKYPETIKRIYEEGHYIANHGYTHVYSQIYANPQSVLDEYNRCNDAVKNAVDRNPLNICEKTQNNSKKIA